VDKLDDGALHVETQVPLHSNESVARVVAFAGPYFFWATVFSITLGIFWLR
jgi:hypothetical protein